MSDFFKKYVAEQNLNQAIENKVDKVEGKSLSTNDYTNEEKEKLASIESGANKTTITTSPWASSDTNVMSSSAVQQALAYSVADWESQAEWDLNYIRNKPFYTKDIGGGFLSAFDEWDGEDDGNMDSSTAEVTSTANGELLYCIPMTDINFSEAAFDIIYNNPNLYTDINFKLMCTILDERSESGSESFEWEVIPYARIVDDVKTIYFGNASCLPNVSIIDAPETNCPYAVEVREDVINNYVSNFYTKDSKVFNSIVLELISGIELKKLDNKFLDIDPTLSISGAPADAAAVSEAIENIEMVGKDVTGETLILPAGNQETAQEYAEIFNDYENNAAIGKYSHAEGSYTVALSDYSHAEGYYTAAKENYSHAENYKTEAYGIGSHAEGYETKARADYSHAEGYQTEVNFVKGGHAEGYGTLAKGLQGSHAEGIQTTASGNYASHAEGFHTVASSSYAHAEGTYTNATNTAAHAEGSETTASGEYSHAEGRGTIASAESQHVEGKYNIDNPSSIHIAGNGTSNMERSNAHTLDWDGNAWFSGDVYIGSTSGTNKDDGSKKLATEEYVNSPKSQLILIDQETGENYIVCIKNGNLVSYKAE